MASKLTSIIALLWAGMIMGISFLESWVKFRTPSITKEIAFDVGRTVFGAFHIVQWFLLGVLVVCSLFAKLTLTRWVIIGILTVLFLLQSMWLLPTLNGYVTLILSGNKPPHSIVHGLYGIFEILKFVLLITLCMK